MKILLLPVSWEWSNDEALSMFFMVLYAFI